MKQAALDLNLSLKKTRKREFLEQMEHVVTWAALVMLIAPYYPEGRIGRPPFELEIMLRTHFLQQWFSLSDPTMEEAFFDTPLYREFAQLDANGRMPEKAPSCGFATGWRNTNWPMASWRRSMICCSGMAAPWTRP